MIRPKYIHKPLANRMKRVINPTFFLLRSRHVYLIQDARQYICINNNKKKKKYKISKASILCRMNKKKKKLQIAS